MNSKMFKIFDTLLIPIIVTLLLLVGCDNSNLEDASMSTSDDEGDTLKADIEEGSNTADSSGEQSPNGVETLEPEGAIESTGTWGLGTRAEDMVYIAGMRGIDPETNDLISDPKERIEQGFLNMENIAESEGATLQDATRIVVYVSDMYRYRPIVNEVQEEMWDGGPYPPRTIVEVNRMNDDDIFEVEGTFYAPKE